MPSFYPAVQVAKNKDDAVAYKPVAHLPRYQFWRPNDHHTIAALVVDIDHLDDWLMKLLTTVNDHPALQPSWTLHKASNGHGQVGWLIEPVATGPNSRRHPQDYARAVRASLTTWLDGDPCFTNTRCWNPLAKAWNDGSLGDIYWGTTRPRSLGELHRALVAADLWAPTSPTLRPSTALEDAEGRNPWIFNETRLRRAGTVAEVAHALNDSLLVPLSPAEVAGIIRSIEGWERKNGRGRGTGAPMDEHQRALQRARGRKGGMAGTDKQLAARAKGPETAAVVRSAEGIGRAATITALAEQGWSAKDIVRQTGASKTTVYRVLKEAREAGRG